MKIAVDAMGGDFAPRAIVQGVLDALADKTVTSEIILVGRKDAIEAELAGKSYDSSRLSIVHAPEVVEMTDSPVDAVRTKKKSSLSITVDMVKKGQADGMISAGNTGAVLVAAQLKLRTIAGIERPAICLVFPTATGSFLMLDGGANSDCRPNHLQQFGVMGSVYAKYFCGIDNPRVGLLNIGHEEGKGNELVKDSYPLLADAPVEFVGNIEGKDAFEGRVDVVVADGFVGNVILKFSESLAQALIQMLKNIIKSKFIYKIGAVLMLPVFKEMRRRTHYAQYGAAPLLGINGVCMKAHGTSSAEAIKNAVKNAEVCIANHVNDHIAEAVASMN